MSDEANSVDSDVATEAVAEVPEAEVLEVDAVVEVAYPTDSWTPADFIRVARDTADALCTHVEMALTKDNPAAIRFREDVNRLLEQIELEIR